MQGWNMFGLALLIGIYSYSIFILGILGILINNSILIFSAVFVLALIYIYSPKIIKLNRTKFIYDKEIAGIIFLIIILALVNLFGVLGPEIAFDALWYHLTLPKIFLQSNSIFFIDGGLFYYSVMPKLIDLLYIPAILYFDETGAKFVHYILGILVSISIYQLSRKFFDIKLSLLAVVIFYSNLVVSWQSITAYVDLGRTFYEILALFGIINWFETKNKKWLIISAMILGLAFVTKLIALGSLFIFIPLIIYITYLHKEKLNFLIKSEVIFVMISLMIVTPWFLFAYLSTGNPIYPLFSQFYGINHNYIEQINPINMYKSLIILFTKSSDPISPIYLIFLPLILFVYKKFDKRMLILLLYSALAIVIWLITPNTGGGRFIMPYLPAFSILAVAVIANTNRILIKKYLVILIIFVALITLFYRGLANYKYTNIIFGNETKEEFLSKNLNFSFGEFYDIDGWFEENINMEDRVLLIGFHNLYYVNFPYIHESYLNGDDKFNFIATQNVKIPSIYSTWKIVYQNDVTNVKVYEKRK